MNGTHSNDDIIPRIVRYLKQVNRAESMGPIDVFVLLQSIEIILFSFSTQAGYLE